MTKRKRPSLGRSREKRGYDEFDTPPIALAPLFTHEPLLHGVTTVCEPFCGKGNLVLAMRQRGLIVFASDIQDRGCPGSSVLDFRQMTERPCDVMVTNPAYAGIAGGAMEFLEHAWTLEFRLVVFLLKVSFLCTEERYERMYPRGHLRRVHVLAERLPDMHDAKHLANGGEKAAPAGVHGWFVFDLNYCGLPTINPVSIHAPEARMPWVDNGNGYHGPRGTSRAYVLARLARIGRDDVAAQVEAGELSVRAALKLTATLGGSRIQSLRSNGVTE